MANLKVYARPETLYNSMSYNFHHILTFLRLLDILLKIYFYKSVQHPMMWMYKSILFSLILKNGPIKTVEKNCECLAKSKAVAL